MNPVAPAVLLTLSLAGIIGALHCLADHLLVSALIYAVAAAALAGVAAKVVVDSI